MTVKQNNSVKSPAKLYNSLFGKLVKQHLLMKGRLILSLPIPLSYEVWREIHREVENLEKELEE